MITLTPCRGPRTRLRALHADDSAAFVAAAQRSVELHRPWTQPPATPEAFAARLARVDAGHRIFVLEAPGGALAGTFELSQIVLGGFCNAYLGYSAFNPWAGRGFMGEGLALLLHVAFHQLGLHRVEANIQPENTRSVALVQRAGFIREGYSPGYLKIGGVWRDHERWAIRSEIFAAGFTPTLDP